MRRWIFYAFMLWPALLLWGGVAVLGFMSDHRSRADFFLIVGGLGALHPWAKIADRKGWSERVGKRLGLSYRDI